VLPLSFLYGLDSLSGWAILTQASVSFSASGDTAVHILGDTMLQDAIASQGDRFRGQI